MSAPDLNAFPPDNVPVTISASRLKKVGGEKGQPGCERRYVGEYRFGMKQSGSPSTELGTALHSLAEHFQATGEVADPESNVGRIFRSGYHLVETTGKLLVEHEHVGLLPDATAFVAYLDGHSARGGETNLVVIQDLKTCGNPAWALEPGAGEHGLVVDLQAMFYAWILLCLPHWFCPPLPEGHYGPKHWQWWDPIDRKAHSARLRWLYFLTKGKARAWDSTDWVTPEQAVTFMANTIMPHVTRIVALDAWVTTHPGVTLNEFDRNLSACGGRGRFCGVAEHDGCDFSALGTPILQLSTKGPRPVSNPLDRLAALTKKVQGNLAPAALSAPVIAPPAAVPPAPAPELTPVTPVAIEAEAAPSVEALAPTVAETAPAKRRGRPPKSAGVGINPPEEGTIEAPVTEVPVTSAQAELTPVRPAAPVAETSSDQDVEALTKTLALSFVTARKLLGEGAEIRVHGESNGVSVTLFGSARS